jgi:Tol biopolymer transport system component
MRMTRSSSSARRRAGIVGVIVVVSGTVGSAGPGVVRSAQAATSVEQIAYDSVSTGPSVLPSSSVIGVVGIDGSGARTISTAEPASEPAWNPRGTLLAFTAVYPDGEVGVRVIDPTSGQEKAVTPEGYHTPVWSPDGTRIAVGAGSTTIENLAVVSADGGTPKVLISYLNLGLSVTNRPAWSPDGSRIAAVLTQFSEGDQGSSVLATVGVDGSGYQAVATNGNGNNGVSGDFEQVAWSPDGKRLLFDANTNGRDVAGTGAQAIQSLDAAAHGGNITVFGSYGDIGAYSTDGRLAVATINGDVAVAPSESTGAARLVHVAPQGHTDSRPTFAVNNTKVVFCETDGSTGATDLYAVNVDGSGATRLTTGGKACDPAVASHAPRFAGATRVETAISASRATYSSASAIVIARDDLYPDALAAAPLAAKVGGPLLLSTPNGVPPVLKAEVNRLGTKTAYVIGDTTALSSQVDTDLRASGVTSVVRIGGRTRYDTAEMIAERVGGPAAYVVRGDNWPDAASVSALAAFQRRAILLTPQDSLSAAVSRAISNMHLTAVTIVGGEAAVGAVPERDLVAAGESVSRIAGPDRWGTSAAVADSATAAGMTGSPWLADGLNWPDAVAAGPAAAVAHAVLLLVDPTSLPASPASATWLAAHPAQEVVAVGGPDVVAPAVVVSALRE